MTCTKDKLVVETEKGTYILSSEKVVGRCAAEERCLEMGSILAPLTEKSEFDAIINAMESCVYQRTEIDGKYIGLSISYDNTHRIFSNGVEFDKDLHGDLYEENKIRPGSCPGAFLLLIEPKLQIGQIWGCSKVVARQYICFKPKKNAELKALTNGVASSSLSLLVIAGSSIVALVCLVVVLLIKNKKQALKISQLTSNIA